MVLNRLGIRARITGGSLLIAIAISVIAGIIIHNQVGHIVYDGELSVLKSIAAPYRTALSTDPVADIDPPGSGQVAAVLDPSGRARVDTLPSALRARLPSLLPEAGTDAAGADEEPRTRTVVAEGVTFLVQTTSVPTTQGVWQIVAARNGEAQVSVLNSVTLLLIVSLAVINLGFGGASWLIGTVALNPVTRLRRSAEQLASRRSSELLPVGQADDEIAQLARTLNELIGELRASAERERQIVSDASHELRTPLAILRTKLELAQAQATTLAGMRTEVASAQQTLLRLSALAASLLELSRIDAQFARGAATADELATELADAADRGRLRVGGAAVLIDFVVEVRPQARTVAVAAHDFGRICDNLVGNALAARPDGGRIELTLREQPDGVLLVVDDESGGMDPSFVPHAFDRFARDPRTSGETAAGSPAGAGLGLAIVSGIVAVAGGRVRLLNQPGRGLRVEVELPFAGGGDTPIPAKRGD